MNERSAVHSIEPHHVGAGRYAVLILLYVAAAAVNWGSVEAVSASGVLTGEEMSVSIRDALFTVQARTQAGYWSTGFAAPFYYWVGSHVAHPFGLFDGRDLKVVTMALLAPLICLVLRRRLGCTFGTSAPVASSSCCFPAS